MSLLAAITLVLVITADEGKAENGRSLHGKRDFQEHFYNPMFINPVRMIAVSKRKHLEGSDLILPCTAIGSPPVKYSWTINGKHFEKVYRKHLKRNGSTLKVKRIRSSDRGLYTCTASNVFGNLSFVFDVKVKDHPSKKPTFYDYNIMMRQKYTFRSTSNTLRFRCQAKGSFPITYTWLKNGRPFSHESRVFKNKVDIKDWSLRIRKLSLMDGGNYTCIAKNSYGSVAFSFFLTMLRTRSGGPPRVVSRSGRPVVKAKEGRNVSLECLELTSQTLPFVTWHKWSKTLDEKTALRTILSGKQTKLYRSIDPTFYDTFTVESAEELNNIQWLYDQTKPYGLRLNLSHITRADSGMYTCTASNSAGEDLAKIELEVGDNDV